MLLLSESCRKACRERVLKDMLGSIVDSTGGGWKVLVLDDLTTRRVLDALNRQRAACPGP